MASCSKCRKQKLFTETIAIKKNIDQQILKKLTLNYNEEKLIICKSCFFEVAEFLDVNELIDEIPETWMQDDTEFVGELKEEEQKFAEENGSLQKNLNVGKEEYNEACLQLIVNQEFSQQNSDFNVVSEAISDKNSNATNQLKDQQPLENVEQIETYEISDDSCTSDTLSKTLLRNDSKQELENENLVSIEVHDDSSTAESYINENAVYSDSDAEVVLSNHSQSDNNAADIIKIEDSLDGLDETANNGFNEQMELLEEFEKRCENLKETVIDVDSDSEGLENVISHQTLHNTSDCNAEIVDEYDKTVFVCSICGRINDELEQAQRHISFEISCAAAQIEKCALETAFCCEYCDLYFRLPVDLQAHRSTGIHSDLMYKCNFCDKIFKEFKVFTMHKTKHTKPRLKFNIMYLCNVGNCIKMYIDWSRLSQHKAKSHVTLICPQCKCVFSDTRVFSSHLNDCEKICQSCGKNYKNFQKHSVVCKPTSKCRKCCKEYSSYEQFQQHLERFHTPIDCVQCGKIFRNKYSLEKHKMYCSSSNTES